MRVRPLCALLAGLVLLLNSGCFCCCHHHFCHWRHCCPRDKCCDSCGSPVVADCPWGGLQPIAPPPPLEAPIPHTAAPGR